jgi:cytochrome oxidase Cu insertion factor (SCO1/SenC/PrrC family)
VHSVPVAVDDDAKRRTWAGRWKMLALFAVCASPVVAAYFAYFVVRPESRANYAALIEPRPLPALPLADLDGRAVAAATLKGQWLLVVVGGGACDDACERRLYLQRQLREMTGRERDRIDKVWFVVDAAPVRAPLAAALAAAPPTRVLRVPRDALAAWLAPAAGRVLEDHVYVVDPLGQWMMRAPATPDPYKLARDLERLLRASASWDRAGR